MIVQIERIDLNEPKIISKVINDDFGLRAAKAWKSLINPYTPRDSGQMEDTAKIEPWTIIYDAQSPKGYKYPKKVYYGVDLKFKKIYNPYATYRWDKAAEQAGQKSKLYRMLNNR